MLLEMTMFELFLSLIKSIKNNAMVFPWFLGLELRLANNFMYNFENI